MKKLQKLNRKQSIQSIRYSEDKSLKNNNSDGLLDNFSKIKSSFLINHLPITKKISPKIFKVIEECLESLNVDMTDKISVFIYNNEEMNAKCLSGIDGNVIIAISSSLVKFFNDDELKFVIGHELGHYIFHSNAGKNKSLEGLIKSRGKEITADRTGLLCCKSIETALRAIIKLLSGLDDEYMNFDVNAILEEFRELDISNIPIEEMYSTHPPLLIRSRALLLFSMGSAYLNLIGEDGSGGLSQDSVDQKVKNDIEKHLDSRCLEYINKNKDNFTFWALSLIFLEDREFNKREQKIMEDLFGKGRVQKLIHFIKSSSQKNTFKTLSRNCKTSFDSYFDEAPQESILYLSNFNNNFKDKKISSNALSHLLTECPDLNNYLIKRSA